MTPHLRIIIRALLSQDNVDIYDYHERYGLSPFQIFDALSDLGKLGIAEMNDGRIRRSAAFFHLVLIHRHKIFGRARAPAPPRKVASREGARLDGYIPDYRRVDKSVLRESNR